VTRERRNRWQLYAKLLAYCLIPTQAQELNDICHYPLLDEIVPELESMLLLNNNNGEYQTTDKGKTVLNKFHRLDEMIDWSKRTIP
jgi:predicted transcriptional regulator